jgi:NAD(P)H-hydrate repair Nnr-like enzyme with NAD(P)H-hydrate dehydratase domain
MIKHDINRLPVVDDAGAVAHARAGDLASERVGPDGIIAGDVNHDLPRVFANR